MDYRDLYESQKESYEEFLEKQLDRAIDCSLAYMELCVCRTICKNPSKKLIRRVSKARKFLEEVEGYENQGD